MSDEAPDPDDGAPPREDRLGRLAPLLVLFVAIEALLAWLTFQGGEPNVVLLVVVGLIAGAHIHVTRPGRFDPDRQRDLLFLVYLVGLLLFLAAISGGQISYLIFISITIGTYALFALGLNLEFGYTGIINFGHVAFMGIGAYAATILSRQWLPMADELTRVSPMSAAMIVGSALLVFVIAAVLVSAGVRRLLEAPSERTPLVAGGIAGGIAAAATVWTVSFPLQPAWASAYIIGAAVLAGMVLAAGFGLVLGLPTLRLRQDYLAIVTIGAAEILRRVWRNEPWLTNGAPGLNGFGLPATDPPTWSFPLPFSQGRRQWEWLQEAGRALGLPDAYKLLLLGMVVVAIVLVYALYEILVQSPYGRVLKAIREDEQVAESLGKNVFAYKLQALALGSAVAALAGALLAWQNVYINYRTFLPIVTFYAWIIVVLGGAGSNKGTVIGALFLWTFFESTRFLNLTDSLGITSTQAAALRILLIGVLLIAFMMFKPEGLLGRKEELAFGD